MFGGTAQALAPERLPAQNQGLTGDWTEPFGGPLWPLLETSQGVGANTQTDTQTSLGSSDAEPLDPKPSVQQTEAPTDATVQPYQLWPQLRDQDGAIANVTDGMIDSAGKPLSAAPTQSAAPAELDVSTDEAYTLSTETTSEAPLGMSQSEGPSLLAEGVKTIGMLTLLLVGFWWISNWLKKSGRLAKMSGSDGKIECVSVLSVGQKEKLALIRVRNQEVLVGITAHGIATLHSFESQPTSDREDPSEQAFNQAMDEARSAQ